MSITYRELIEHLKSLPEEHLDDDVTVFVSGPGGGTANFLRADGVWAVPVESGSGSQESALDDGHPYLVI